MKFICRNLGERDKVRKRGLNVIVMLKFTCCISVNPSEKGRRLEKGNECYCNA